MVWTDMSNLPAILPNDPIALKAMILALQAENARMDADIEKMSATLRAHEALVHPRPPPRPSAGPH